MLDDNMIQRHGAGWLWSGSSLYAVSAALIMAGIFKILTPIYDQPEQALEKYGCLAILNVYEAALLAAALVIIAKRVYDDAVTLTALMALFLIGTAMALDTVAPDSAQPALLWGLGGLAAACGKLRAWDATVVGRFGRWVIAGLVVILAWNFLMPAVLGYAMRWHVATPDRVPIWGAGWWLMMVGGLLIVRGASGLRCGLLERSRLGRPLLRTPIMRWALIVIILLATFAHQATVAWAFLLPLKWGDFSGATVIASLLALALWRAMGGRWGAMTVLVFYTPLAVLTAAYASGEHSFGLGSGLSVINYPPAMAAVFVVGAAWTMQGVSRTAKQWLLSPYLLATALSFGLSPSGVAPPLTAVWRWMTDWSNTMYQATTGREGYLLVAASFAALAVGLWVSWRKGAARAGV